ncbi:phospholipase-like protein [Tanacetum coccineum]
MLAPKGSTYNGRPTFANPMYLKKAQSEKPCLYEIPYDTSDLANRFSPDRDETLTLEQENLQYVQSLEKEIDELDYDKAEFSNIYDLLLQECVSKDVINSNVNAVCVTCEKCVFNSNHDACVSKFIDDVDARTKKPKVVPISTRKPKSQANKSVATSHKKTVASDSTIQKSNSNFRMLTKDETPELEKGIEHQTYTPRTPEQNSVVKRRNRTLVEAARTMLSAYKHPLFFWVEAIATACYTQNRSLIIKSQEHTPYHIINGKKPSFKHLHIFGFTCYITRDGENISKMKEKGDPCILELTKASDYDNSGPVPQLQKTFDHNSSKLNIQDHNNKPSSSTLVPNVSPPADTNALSLKELEFLFSHLFEEYFIAGNQKNMEKNHEDPPVTLTIRNTDDSLENYVLIHFMSCRQIESLHEHTDAVTFTYHLNGHFIEFGREEFCLITGLRFGPESSDHCVEGINPFKRLLFGSDIDGGRITGQMLLDKINDEEFSKLQDDDVVAVCQLAVFHLILLGRQPAHNIPEWWFRLIVDKNKWKTYPWGSYVWAKLYRQLRYANRSRWDRFYACQALPNRPPAKRGYWRHIKYWPLNIIHINSVILEQLLGHIKRFKRENLMKFFDGALPNRKLRPDDFEAKAEWWICSRDFFDGRIREAPPIPPRVNLTSQFDVPKYIDQRFHEQEQIIKELHEKNAAQDRLLNEVYNFYKGQSKPVEVHEHYGLTDFSGFQNSQASDSFYDVGQTTPIYSATFEQPMSSQYPTSYPDTPHIATPMAQQGFAPWSSTSYQVGPSHVGGINPDAMHRGKREIFPSKYQLTPFTCLPDTTVAPKKQANNIRNTTRNAIVSPFNLGKAGIDLNSQVEELMYLGSRATDDYISLHNMDHTKVVRYKYVDCMRFLESPESVYLDCFIKGFVVEVRFWRELVPYLCKGAISTGSNLDHIGWLSDDVYMPINTGGRIPSLIDHISKWTNVLNVLLEKAGHLKEQDGDHTILSYYTIKVWILRALNKEIVLIVEL